MLLLLGQRKTETVLMRWKDIDETVWRIPGRFRKGNRAHSVPLSKGALKILDELRPVNGAKERVFHGVSAANLNGRAFGAVREAVMKAAKTDSFTVHDLRRTLATQIRELCHVQPHVVSGILGHSTGKFAAAATSFYDKSTGQDERTAALEAWSKKVSEIAAEGKGASKAGENPPLF